MSTNRVSSFLKQKLTIRTKLFASAVITIGLALVVGITISLLYRNVGQALRTERFADQVINDVSDLSSLSYAYLLLKEMRPRVQWQIKHASLGKLLSGDLSGMLEEQALVARLRSSHERIKELFDAVVKSNEESHVVAKDASSPYDELSEGIIAQLLARSETMIQDASLLQRDTSRRMDAVRRHSTLLVIASAFMLIVSASLAASFVAKSLGGSIRTLERGTQKVADGDLNHRVEVHGNDELSHLAVAFNDMTAKLATSYLSLEREIGERRQAEKALKELNETLEQRVAEQTEAMRRSEARLSAIYASMTDGMASHEVVYSDGKPVDYLITDVNPAFERITGVARTAALGRRASELYGTGSAPYLDKYAAVAEGGRPITFETYFPPMQKHFAISVFSPEQGKFAAVFSDITERKRAEWALRQTAAALEAANDELRASRTAALNLMEDADSARQRAEEASAALRKSLDERIRELHEKEVLLKEVHHRVKNNLQVISSLVGLQASGSTDEKVRGILEDVAYRVRSMALVHEKLYQAEDLAHIDFGEYARSLLGYLWRAHGTAAASIRLTFDVEPVALPVDIAVPCGLILNELAGNALKHAFQGKTEGEVTISLKRCTDSRVSLSVRDNGAGLPVGLDWRQTGSLGLRLVQMLAGQLGATVEVSGEHGTEFRIKF